MKIFIAGASGAIGRPLVRRLVAAGHEVVGVTRSRPEAIEQEGGRAVVLDALDADALRSAVAEAAPEVVVNQLTDLNRPLNPRKYDEWLEGTNRLRTECTRSLVAAAEAAGASKLVSQSVAFAYGFEPGVKTEDSPLIGMAGREMGAAIQELERQTLAAPGGIVLRYGFFYGPGTSIARDGQQVEMIRKRQLPIIGGGVGHWPFIHVEDAASATVAAIERGQAGVYNVVDDEPALGREWIPHAAELIGARKPMRVPGFIARLVAGPMAVMATRMQPVSNRKAKGELGWTPRYPSWRDGFRAELG